MFRERGDVSGCALATSRLASGPPVHRGGELIRRVGCRGVDGRVARPHTIRSPTDYLKETTPDPLAQDMPATGVVLCSGCISRSFASAQ